MIGFPALITLGITLASAVLLIGEWLRPDVVALLVLAVLGITRLVTPTQAFEGFSGTAVITILSIFIISEGLRQTGITRWIGRLMMRLGGQNETRLMLVTILGSACLSLFMNNVAAVGVLLPAVISLSRQTRVPPSRLLIPLAFGTILGGMATLLTTSNIILSGALRDAGFAPFGLLDFLPVGLPVVAVGTLYMLTVGRKLLPRQSLTPESSPLLHMRDELPTLYDLEKNLTELEILPESQLAGSTILAGQWSQRIGITVVGVARRGQVRMAPDRNEILQADDIILAYGEPTCEQLDKFGLRQAAQPHFHRRLTDEGITLAEIVLSPHTRMAGKCLGDFHFREKYNLNVLAIWRSGHPIHTGLGKIPLSFGDALLVQGPASRIRMLQAERDFFVLNEDPDAVLRPHKAALAAVLSLLTLSVAAAGWYSVAVVTFTGAVLMVLTGCLSIEDGYRAIDWRSIFLIAGIWPLSTAIHSTGLAGILASGLLKLTGSASPILLAAFLLLVTGILTNVMAGQAAAPIVVAPIGLALASATGVDPRALAMVMALGCSLAFPTPIGHPVNVMVMGPGGYTFRDYLRVGLPLAALVFITILAGIYVFWPLQPHL